ncbi:MAG TPA: Uma2 family endonuclease [Gemmataceae bacterium]|jgi:Uma2 family endonuclease|nr:Uma2 family endonuclease [Gemmataceae bacterium]
MSTATIPPRIRAGNRMSEALIEALPDLEPGDPMVLTGVTWAMYERLLVERDRIRPGVRLTYDRGRLEIMTVSRIHERWKGVLRRLLERLTDELQIPIVCGGSLTIRRADLERGLEPDECYYVQNALQMVEMRELDFTVDIPFDLVIEVEQSRTIGSRLPVLDQLGVPEVWLYNGKSLRILQRQPDGGYRDAATSMAFPQLLPADWERFMSRMGELDDMAIVREFMDWIRTTLIPRLSPDNS